MDKTFVPEVIESRWSQYWATHQTAQVPEQGEPYSIMLPPPNVTGTLHMGHGFQQTLMDALIRYHRMKGQKTLWQPGTDHAGIATQMVVERQLAQEGYTRHDLGRENFIQRVWAWKAQSGNHITQQMRRLGTAIDWTRERFSMDEHTTHATIEAFIRLYEKGLIYRGKRLVNWDPKLHTAISDLEVNNKTESGQLWYIRYPLSTGKGHLVVATTRPETMLGDTAVAVHPDDPRYQALIGQTIDLPLTDRQIPVIADDSVDQAFGTGCVKITPAHDFNDYAMGQRHNLPMINLFTPDAKLNEHAPAAYQGLERFEARKQIVADLTKAGFIEKIEPHTLNVPYGDRSDVVIEPMLTDQWFVRAKPLAEKAIDVVEKKRIQFVPANWEKTYLQWLYQIEDWCISRQLWWGHRIPVWYDDAGKPYVGHNEQDARQRAGLSEDTPLQQDQDVLDTWFTASLYPFSTLGWPVNTPDLKAFYPSSVLVTGFDIIFFWVARMVMMGCELVGDIPFREVYITGLIRDHLGQKMSKSKGNVLDPIDLIDGISLDALIQKRCSGLMQPQLARSVEKVTRQEFPEGILPHGTDALRFTFCALASTGRDIHFDMGRIEGYRNFCNKLWNASRYVLMHTESTSLEGPVQFSLADRWIRSILQDTIDAIQKHFKQYRFDLIANTLHQFFWDEYCDWYLELSKCVLNSDTASQAELTGTRRTLLEVLETCLRLMHPVMPFITEEIWHRLAPQLKLPETALMHQPFPEPDTQQHDTDAVNHINWLKQLINGIRNIRGEINISPAKKTPLILSKGTPADHTFVQDTEALIQSLARIDHITWHTQGELPASATTVIGSLECHIPLAGLIDKSAEIKRLQKEMEKLRSEMIKSQQKLNNPNYVNKAPEAVVAKERERLAQTEHTLEKLQSHYARIEGL